MGGKTTKTGAPRGGCVRATRLPSNFDPNRLAQVFLGLFAFLLFLALLLLAGIFRAFLLLLCEGRSQTADGQRHAEHHSHQSLHCNSPLDADDFNVSAYHKGQHMNWLLTAN